MREVLQAEETTAAGVETTPRLSARLCPRPAIWRWMHIAAW